MSLNRYSQNWFEDHKQRTYTIGDNLLALSCPEDSKTDGQWDLNMTPPTQWEAWLGLPKQMGCTAWHCLHRLSVLPQLVVWADWYVATLRLTFLLLNSRDSTLVSCTHGHICVRLEVLSNGYPFVLTLSCKKQPKPATRERERREGSARNRVQEPLFVSDGWTWIGDRDGHWQRKP